MAASGIAARARDVGKTLLGLICMFGTVLAGLVACGGSGGVDSGGTGSYAAGAISGFGSVIVNGVRYDDQKATVRDDDGHLRSAADLALGMTAEIEASAIANGSSGPTAQASSIRTLNQVVGPAGVVNEAAGTVQVLGQTVHASASTVFGDGLTGRLAAIVPGEVLTVYGSFDIALARYNATRIERSHAATTYKLRNVVATIDRAAKILVMGGQTIDYAGLFADALPRGMAAGSYLRAVLAPKQHAGRWIATALTSADLSVPDRTHAEIESGITAFTSARDFSLAGLAVDASAASFPNGTAGVVLGARVAVTGNIAGSVLKADEVKVETEAEDREIELHGRITAASAPAGSFVVRGVTVVYGDATRIEGGAARLVVGASVEVHGTLSADGMRVDASEISVED